MWGKRIVFCQNFWQITQQLPGNWTGAGNDFHGPLRQVLPLPSHLPHTRLFFLAPITSKHLLHTGFENKPSENKMRCIRDMGKLIVASSLCLSPSSACLLHKVFHDLCMFPSWSLEQPNKDSSVQGDSMVVVVFCFHFVICRCYLNANLIRMKNSRLQ